MSAAYRRRAACALCGKPGDELQAVMELAATPPANEFVSAAAAGQPQDTFPLTLLLCPACGHLQLAELVDPARLFTNYVYVSGTSPVFVKHFADYAATCIERFGLGAEDLVVEVGSNDGTLLKQFQQQGTSKVLGIDPAAKIAQAASEAGVPTMEAFFDSGLGERLRAEKGPAALVCANNVFAHMEGIRDFAEGVRALLGEEGVFVFEVSYLVDVVEKLLFDTIYHEHASYHALAPLARFFEQLGMRLFDAERISSHGGSIRCFVCHEGARHEQGPELARLIAHEEELGLFAPETYAGFKARITDLGARLRARLSELRAEGKQVAGFGAPAKLTTLMYEFGLGSEEIAFIVDDSPWKQGQHTPGHHILVRPSDALYEEKPAACVVFAWNFADPIINKHTAYVRDGGTFIVPLPELREV